MKPMEHSAFPSDETLAAFIDGRLDEETRKRVVAHVADCEDCYGTFEAAGAWQRESESRGNMVTIVPRRNRRLIAVAAAAVLGGVLLYQPLSVRYREHEDLAKLREAANAEQYRPSDARLSADLECKPFPRYRGGSSDDSDDVNMDVALAQVRMQAHANANVANQHLLGIALLLDGKSDDAARILGEAILAKTGTHDLARAISRCTDVSLLNDLSAARGAVADLHGDSASSQIALAAANRAWQLDPKSPVTVWNRAVAIERANPKAAIAVWRDYVENIDRTSAWSVEAQSRLARIGDDR
jgi:hypothetical protein